MPTPEEIEECPDLVRLRTCLSNLFGKDVAVQESQSAPTSDLQCCATYRSDEDAVVAAIVADFSFCVSTACALALFPPARAKTTLEKGTLTDQLLEDLHEVMNVLALSIYERAPCVRLHHMEVRKLPFEDEVAAGLSTRDAALAFDVEVPSYPGGVLEIYRDLA